MTDFEKIILKGEGKTLEFKAQLPTGNSIAKSAISFSNMAGGKIIIGVEDKTCKIVGISEKDALDLPDKISNIIFDCCTPVIIPEIYTIQVLNKTVLVIELYPGGLKPYHLKKVGKQKGTYIRVGGTNKIADDEMIVELERQRRNISLDEENDFNYSADAIDVKQLSEDFQRYTGLELGQNDLLTLKIMNEDSGRFYPTIGGLLIAGRKEYSEFYRIKCARFKGNDMLEFIDQKEFSGPLHHQVENTMKFAMVYLAKSGKIKGLQRDDQYDVPVEAIREAVVNAVVHRDYSITGADIKFAVFDDRIEITSPGALPKSLGVEDLLTGRSEIRNRVIARFFKEIKFIEQWGTGVGRIVQSCQKQGLKTPEFIERGLFFKVILHKTKKSKVPRKVPRKLWK